jgi:hypothetical protein
MSAINRFVAFLAVGLIAICCGMLLGMTSPQKSMTSPQKRGSSQMKPLTVNALPEEGLLITSPEDPLFMEALRASAWAEKDPPSNAALQFSGVISNNSDQAVAAISVVWEFIQPDGRAIRREKIARENSLFGDDDALYDLAAKVGTLPRGPAHRVLEPHTKGLFSLVSTQSAGSATGSSVGQGVAPLIGQTSQRLDPTAIRQKEMDLLSAILEKSVSWSVSIDGAFFEDGRFAGPNKGDFFGKIAAEHKARIDLLQELEKLIKAGRHGQDFNKVFQHLAKVAGSQRPNLTGVTASNLYDFRKSILAGRLMAIRERAGDQTIIDFVTRESVRPHVELIAPRDVAAPPHSRSGQRTR